MKYPYLEGAEYTEKMFDKSNEERKAILKANDMPETIIEVNDSIAVFAKGNKMTLEKAIAFFNDDMRKLFKRDRLFRKLYFRFGFRATVHDFIFAMTTLM